VKPGPRFVPSDLTPRERRIYLGAAAVLAVVFCALVWPVYPLFAGIRPLVLGVPLSLAWVVAWLLVSFVTLLALFLWEGRRGGRDDQRRRRDGSGRDDRARRDARTLRGGDG
jgi:membrane protein implicated in regulation of membrane protease activity